MNLFARKHMGWVLMRLGQMREAIGHFQQAIEIQDDDPWVLNDLAWILATDKDVQIRDGAQAVELAESAGRLLGYKFARNFITLAAAKAEVGQFGLAVENRRKALDLANGNGNTVLANEIENHLESYEARRPWRE